MTRIDELFAAFEAEHRAGGSADPRAYLRELDGEERARLAELIDAYLDDAPAAAWSAEAYEHAASSPRTQDLLRRVDESLTDLLAMANQAELLPREVAARLAGALGLDEHEEVVRARYHELQSGRAPVEKVAGRVWDALAAIFGTTRDRVRAAAERAAAAADDHDLVFARSAPAPPEPARASSGAAASDAGEAVVDAVFFDD